MRNEDLAGVLEGFREGVRVNVVVRSCDAGAFMDKIGVKGERKRFVHTDSSGGEMSPSGRFGNCVFSGGFLRSLGFDGASQTTDWTPSAWM